MARGLELWISKQKERLNETHKMLTIYYNLHWFHILHPYSIQYTLGMGLFTFFLLIDQGQVTSTISALLALLLIFFFFFCSFALDMSCENPTFSYLPNLAGTNGSAISSN